MGKSNASVGGTNDVGAEENLTNGAVKSEDLMQEGETGTSSAAINSYGAGEATGGKNGSTNTTDPLAFVTILIFDKNYTFLDVSYAQLTSANQMLATYTITQPGYAYMYISNEQVKQTDVFFDDVAMTLTPGGVVQGQDYYPFGLTFNSYSRENSLTNKYLYNGKEMQNDLNLGLYDYIARQYDPVLGRFTSVDPAAGLMRKYSPYSYSFDNPIRFTDPDGMVPGDFLNEKGQNIGNDGRNDGKVYVVKTTKTEFDSGVPSAGISKDQAKQTEAYVKANSGNTSAFGAGNIANANSIEIEGSSATRQSMVDEVNHDNGKGGTSDANNREYGGETSMAGTFTPSAPGPVTDPSESTEAHIDLPNFGDDTKSDAHSHPSGTKN